jgi:hypothetical protein
MTSQYRHRRTSNPATVFPNPLEPGEITVNTANRQIAVGDAASATLGAPKALIAIRFFDTAAQYVTNDFVVNSSTLYRANKPTGPGAFVAADWQMMVGAIDPQYVAKAGDTMTGMLQLPATVPTLGVHATNKTYVDNLVALKSSVLVSDVRPTPDPIDSTLWYNTRDGQLYIRYNDGNSVAWVIAAPQPDSSNYVSLIGASAVRYDTAQTLTEPQQMQARSNIYAAPMDALGYSGMQVNSGLEVSQEVGQSFVVLSNLIRTVADNWKVAANGVTIQARQTPVFAGLSGFLYGLNVQTTVVNTAPAAGNEAYFSQRIEGYRVARLGWGLVSARPVTIAFWVWSNRPGMYSGSVTNGAYDRSYTFSYNISAASSWEYKTVTIPGCTDGVWEKENLIGLIVFFTVMSGTDNLAAPGVWNAVGKKGVPGTTNCCQTLSDQMYFTGCVVLPGLEAPSAARSPYIMRPYDQELLTCMRYYEKSYPYADPPGKAYGSIGGGGAFFAAVYATIGYAALPAWHFKATKRSSPATTVFSPWTGATSVIRVQIANADVAAIAMSYNEKHAIISVNGVNVSGGDFIYGHAVADARL